MSKKVPDPLSVLSKKKNGKIELLRFLFALIIAMFHLSCSLSYDNKLFNKGYLAVELFFFVSGYLFAASLARIKPQSTDELISESTSFMWKKYVSVMLYFIPSVFIYAVMWIPYYDLKAWSLIMRLTEMIPNIFLLQIFGFKSGTWMVYSWYLSAMLAVMLILTPIVLKFPRVYALCISPFLSLTLLGSVMHENGNYNVCNGSWSGCLNLGLFRAFAEISLGCTAFYIVQSGVLKKLNPVILRLFAALLLTFSILYMAVGSRDSFEPPVVLSLFAVVLIAFYDEDFCSFLNNSAVGFLGKFSFPFYLCHSVARFYTVKIGSLNEKYALQILVFLLMSIVLSLLCMIVGDAVKKYLTKKKNNKKSSLQN